MNETDNAQYTRECIIGSCQWVIHIHIHIHHALMVSNFDLLLDFSAKFQYEMNGENLHHLISPSV